MLYRMRWRLPLAACVGALPAVAGAGEPLVLQAGIGLKADTPQGRGLEHFARLVHERSRGRIRIELHAAGALGDDLKMIDKLKSGEQAIACPDSSTLASMVGGFSVINYPFTFLNEQEADVILDGKWGSALLERLQPHRLVGLAFWENGFRHMTNSVRPIQDFSSARGLRLRTMQNQMLADAFQELGFAPVPMPFTQVYDALAQKRVDGQENPLPTILSSRFHEVQNHLTLSRHVYSAFVLLLSKRTWDALPAADRQLLRTAAGEAGAVQRRLNREATASALEQLKAKGMQVAVIDARESERVRRRLRHVLDRHTAQAGVHDVLAMYVELAGLRSAAGPRH